MKIVTFFNEKGGVGKSTLTALMTSWLAYSLGEEVAVLEFDGPSYQYHSWREKNLEAAAGGALSGMVTREPYDIVKVPPMPPARMTEYVRRVAESGDGYLFLEFGGSFREEGSDPSRVLLTSGLVDGLIMPVNTDEQSIDAAMYTIMTLRRLRGVRCPDITVLWSGVSANERRTDGRHDWFSVAETQFKAMGARVCGGKVYRNDIINRDAPWPFFVRNTLCWPERNVRFMRMEYLEDIFAELKTTIDNIKR